MLPIVGVCKTIGLRFRVRGKQSKEDLRSIFFTGLVLFRKSGGSRKSNNILEAHGQALK